MTEMATEKNEVRRKTESHFIYGKMSPSLDEIMKIFAKNEFLDNCSNYTFNMKYLPEKHGWQITTTTIY